MSIAKIKRTLKYIEAEISLRKKKIIIFDKSLRIDSLLKTLCLEGFIQTYLRINNKKIIIYPRYNSRLQPLLTCLRVIPYPKQYIRIKPSAKKYNKVSDQILILSTKQKFFSLSSSRRNGCHFLTIT